MDWNGLLNFQDDPQRNMLMQVGLGLLAGNQSGNPAMGAMRGFQNAQEIQNAMQRQKFLEDQAKIQNDEFGLRKSEYERRIAEDQARKQSIQRLLGGQGAYTTEQEVPVQSFQNVPIPAVEGAVAPNFGTARESVTTMQKKPVFDQNAMTQDMIAAGYGDEILKRQLFPAAPEIMIAPDGTVINKNDRSLIGKNFRADRLDVNKPFLLVDGKVVPNEAYQNYELERASRSAPRTSLNVNQNQEKEENKAVGKYFGEQYGEIQKAGFGAQGRITKVERLNQLLQGVETGKFTPLGVEVASAAQSLGINIDPKLGNKQAAEALSNEMALELRNPSGGSGMPGALSDKDREFLKQMVPGIEKGPDGRKLISESIIKLAKRDQEVAKLARDYRKKNGTIDEGFYEELAAYSEKNPLFANVKPLKRGGNVRDQADAIIGGK